MVAAATVGCGAGAEPIAGPSGGAHADDSALAKLEKKLADNQRRTETYFAQLEGTYETKAAANDILDGITRIRFNANKTVQLTAHPDPGNRQQEQIIQVNYQLSIDDDQFDKDPVEIRMGWGMFQQQPEYIQIFRFAKDRKTLTLASFAKKFPFARIDDPNPWTGAPRGSMCGTLVYLDPDTHKPEAAFDVPMLACARGLACTGPAPTAMQLKQPIASGRRPYPSVEKLNASVRNAYDPSVLKTCAAQAPAATP
jgi:hypothetical protein